MFNMTITPQPVTIEFDSDSIESFNEKTSELFLYNIETMEITDSIGDVEFTTEKSYDKKYVVKGFETSESYLNTLKSGVVNENYLTIEGEVTTNTPAKMVILLSSITEDSSF